MNGKERDEPKWRLMMIMMMLLFMMMLQRVPYTFQLLDNDRRKYIPQLHRPIATLLDMSLHLRLDVQTAYLKKTTDTLGSQALTCIVTLHDGRHNLSLRYLGPEFVAIVDSTRW